ncbi:MAG: hypothetical protein K8R53_14145, partial [Bacteroidales bacterium]|nr:hypothetical protein [Bacteroidales bacterium]
MRADKIITISIAVCLLLLGYKQPLLAQIPQAFHYEFLVRTYSGNIATKTPVNLRISILDGSADGSIVYSETHNSTTDDFGMLSLQVGNGVDKSGGFGDIAWETGDFYLKMDELGGKNFMLMPTQKLLSVPFALYAQRATNVDDADPDPANELQRLTMEGDTLKLTGGGWVNLSMTDNQTLQFHDNKLFINNGNEVELPFNYSDTSQFNEIQRITRNGDLINLSKEGGAFVDENTQYSAGEGIMIMDTVIVNTAPSSWQRSGDYLVYDSEGAVIGTQTPEASAALEVASTTRGFLPPRMTTIQRNSIPNPAPGLTVFNIETACLNFFSGSNWIELCGSCTPQPTPANAGSDQPDVTGATTSLAANSPQVGTGSWSIAQGTGGSFVDPLNPKSSFTGDPGVTYLLEWSISNDCGTSVDQVIVSFWSCGFPLTDLRDGQSYKTVKIGDQCWMAENMNFGNMISGSVDQADNASIEKYCFEDNASNCDKYGGLYQWGETVQYNPAGTATGICPAGDWHISSDEEWITLVKTLGVDDGNARKTGLRGVDQGTQLRVGGTSGFDALLGGSRLNNGLFYAINNYGNFWTSTSEGDKAWRHAVSGNTTGVFRTLNDQKEAIG